MGHTIRHAWQRYWLPLGETLLLDGSGFLPDPEEWFHLHYNPKLRTLDSLCDAPLLVLLGEPGAGKSTVLEDEAHRLEHAGYQVHYRRLNEYAEAELVPEVFGADSVQDWLAGSGWLYLLLDSLDECRLTIPKAANLLLRELRKLPTDRLSLYITCRTAEWPPGLTEEFVSLWPEARMAGRPSPESDESSEEETGTPLSHREYELVLLRQRDVEVAAGDFGIGPTEFLRQVRELDIQPFAAQPNTLRMLLSIYIKDGYLPNTKGSIFQRGCALLADELGKTRIQSGFEGELHVSQRLAVAGRIASLMLLGGLHAVWLGEDMESTEGDLLPTEVIGSDEQAGQLRFSIDRKSMLEVLNTSLFTARGTNRLGFGHQSWAEYLAAVYLVGRIRDADRLLMLVRWGEDGRIPPRFIELAGWLASLSQAVFDALAETEPALLLGADLGPVVEDRKARLVEGLMQACLHNQASLWPWEVRRHFSKLGHADLAGQLRLWIVDQALPESVREVALEMALACKQGELAELAADLALNVGEKPRIRASAARLAAELGGSDVLACVRRLALGTDAREDELRTILLPRLWPGHVSTRELFDVCLAAGSWRYLGSYRYDPEELVARFGLDDLLVALRWLENSERSHVDFYGNRLADAVSAMAWSKLEDPRVLHAFARVVHASKKRYEKVFNRRGERVDEPHPFSADATKRRALIQVLLPLPDEPDQAWELVFGDDALLFLDDMPWMLERYKAARSRDSKDRWTQCIRALLLVHGNDGWLDSLIQVACADAVKPESPLADAIAPFLEPAWLGSEEAKQAKKSLARRRELEQRRTRQPLSPPPEVRVRNALKKFAEGKADVWMRLWQELNLPDGAVGYQFSQAYVLKSPGWKRASAEEREQILDCAFAWVMDGDLSKQEANLRNGKLTYLHTATWLALELLWSKRPEALGQRDQARWSVWLPFIVHYPIFDGRNVRSSLIELGFEKLPEQMEAELRGKMDRAVEKGQGLDGVLRDLQCIWSDHVAAWVREAFAKLINHDHRLASLSILLKQQDGPGVHLALTEFDALADAGAAGFEASLDLAMKLLEHAPQVAWPVVWARASADPAFGEMLWARFAYKDGFLSSLGEAELAEMYVWLETHFPAASDPPHPSGEGYEPTRRDHLATLRSTCVSQLCSRGTAEAVQVVEGLCTRFPEKEWLRDQLLHARAALREKAWRSLSPLVFMTFLERPDTRLVRNEAELAEAIMVSLKKLQGLLQGTIPLAPFLWNVGEDERSGRPKSEDRLSDFVAQHLRSDLPRMVIDREIQVRNKRETGIGERTDIKVETLAHDGSSIVVVIETKGCWNKDLFKALGPQLKERYLQLFGASHGIYLVGWFGDEFWVDDDARKRVCRRHGTSRDDLQRQLDELSGALSDSSSQIISFVLNCTHP